MANVPQSWNEYRDAMAAVSPASLAEGDPGEGPDEAAIDAALERSDQLESAITEHLMADDPEVRDLAALQLEAAATADLDNADRLLSMDEGGEEMSASLSNETWDELIRILETPTELGIMAVVDKTYPGTSAAEAGGEKPVGSPADQLKAAVDGAIVKITASSGEAAATTVTALAELPGGAIAKAVQKELEEHFKGLSEALSWIKRKAIGFVLRAVRKLLAIFGSSTEALRQRLENWVDDLDADRMKSVLAVIYGVDGLKDRFHGRVDGAQDLTGDEAKSASEQLSALTARWEKRTWVVDKAGTLLGLVGGKLRNIAPPWGHIAYAAIFLTATGYVVFGGGDYLDWRENDGVLDLVDGVGSIVDTAVGTGAGV